MLQRACLTPKAFSSSCGYCSVSLGQVPAQSPLWARWPSTLLCEPAASHAHASEPFVWGLLLDHNCLQALLCSHATVPSDFLIEHKCKKENIKDFKTAEQNIKPSAGLCRASLVAQLVKNLSAVKETGSIPGLGRSPGGGNGNPLQYSCLENPMNRGAWQATVHGVARVGHNLVTKPPPQACVNGQMIRP